MATGGESRQTPDYILGEIRATVNGTADDVRAIKNEMGSLTSRVSGTETRLTAIETSRTAMLPQYQTLERKFYHHIANDAQWKTAFESKKQGAIISAKLMWSAVTVLVGSSGLFALWEAFK